MITRRQLIQALGATPLAGLMPMPVFASRRVDLVLGELAGAYNMKPSLVFATTQALSTLMTNMRTVKNGASLPDCLIGGSAHWGHLKFPR
jgi:hypothetical protein